MSLPSVTVSSFQVHLARMVRAHGVVEGTLRDLREVGRGLAPELRGRCANNFPWRTNFAQTLRKSIFLARDCRRICAKVPK